MKETTVKDLVSEDFRTAAIFEKHAIDFCCHGNVEFEVACAKNGIAPEVIQKEIELLPPALVSDNENYQNWELDELADEIVRTHHRYVRDSIPVISSHLEKVVNKHGIRHPEVHQIQSWFLEVAEEMIRHMAKEEMVLFPYIKSMAKNNRNGTVQEKPHFGTIANPIRMMEAEHVEAGNKTESIRQACGGYAPPTDACPTFRVTYEELMQFEIDLHKHVHLENNILFPKAIKLEKRLLVS